MKELQPRKKKSIQFASGFLLKMILCYFPIANWSALSVIAQQKFQNSNENIQFSTGWDYKLLAEVLKQLRYFSHEKGNQELYTLLQQVRIEVPIKSLRESNPNAYAFKDDKATWIIIESGWEDQVAGFSELGALCSLVPYGTFYPAFVDDIFYKFCKDFQNKFKAAQQSGRDSTIRYRFKFEDFFSRSKYPIDYILWDKLAGLVATNTYVWTILHEVGHHALKHTSTNRALTNKESRQHEYDADYWAFKQMQSLGYSLFGIDSFLMARGMTEICLNELGLIESESTSTHPSWGNREIALRKYYDPMISHNQYRHVYGIPMGIPDAVLATLTIPNPSQDDFIAYLILRGNAQIGVIEWQGNSAKAYFNDVTGRSEFIIENIRQIVPSIEVRQYDQNNRLVDTVTLLSVQHDEVIMDFLEFKDGMTMSDLRKRVSGNKLMILHLRKVGASESAIEEVLNEAKKYSKNQHYYFLQYAKGIISYGIFKEIATKEGTKYETRLIEILGEYQYQSFNDAFKKEVEKYEMPMTGLDLWEENQIFPQFNK